jgi:hypothetical protein
MYGAFPLLEALFGIGTVERQLPPSPTPHHHAAGTSTSGGDAATGTETETSTDSGADRTGSGSGVGDDSYYDYGASAVELITSCDTGEQSDVGFGSWCGMIKQNASCTMEAWNPRQKPNLSFSHPGATAALISIVQGLMGVRPVTQSAAACLVYIAQF